MNAKMKFNPILLANMTSTNLKEFYVKVKYPKTKTNSCQTPENWKVQTTSSWQLLLARHEPTVESFVKKCTVCARSTPLKISWNPQTTPCTKTTMAKNRYPPIPDKRTQIYSSYGLLLLWLEVYQQHRTTLTDIITVMKDIFSPHGIPEELVSDNGTQYKSNLFCKFVTTWGIQHTTSSPP